jgi:hypothetical protein
MGGTFAIRRPIVNGMDRVGAAKRSRSKLPILYGIPNPAKPEPRASPEIRNPKFEIRNIRAWLI